MKLTVFTRCYVKEESPFDSITDLTQLTIRSMRNLMSGNEYYISWVILVTNVGESKKNLRHFNYLPEGTEVIKVPEKLSCWDARVRLMGHLHANPDKYMDRYFMQLDADDEVINERELSSLCRQSEPTEDLLSFGRYKLCTDGSQPTQELSHEWVRVRKFKKYIASESRAYFNFMFNWKILSFIVNGSLLSGKPHLLDDPTQSTDDTILAIELSRFEFTVGCIAMDFVLYNIHESNISHNRNIEFNNKLSKLLSTKKCYEINGNYYTVIDNSGKLVTWSSNMNPYENILSDSVPLGCIISLAKSYPLTILFTEKPSYCKFLTYVPYGNLKLPTGIEIKFEDYYET